MFLLHKRKQIDSYRPIIWLYADMEGINNITSWDEVNPACPPFKRGAQLMTEEVNSVINGMIKGGAQHVFVNDIHWFHNNIIWKKLHRCATPCIGINLKIQDFFSTYLDAVAIVGMHAKANTNNAILPHTWYLPSYLQSLKLDQKFIGETDLIKLIADEKGIPLIFISGDQAACTEAKEINSEIFAAIVKEKKDGCITLLSRRKANRLIKKTAQQSVQSLIEKAMVPQRKTVAAQCLEATFGSKELSDTIELRCQTKRLNYERIGENIIQFKGSQFMPIFKDFLSVID